MEWMGVGEDGEVISVWMWVRMVEVIQGIASILKVFM